MATTTMARTCASVPPAAMPATTASMRRPASHTCAAGVTLCSNVAPARDAVSCGLVAQTRAMTRRMLCQV